MCYFACGLGIRTVPIVFDDAKLFCLKYSIDEILQMANAPSILNENLPREGIVFRLMDSGDYKVSFKAISNAYLLKHGE